MGAGGVLLAVCAVPALHGMGSGSALAAAAGQVPAPSPHPHASTPPSLSRPVPGGLPADCDRAPPKLCRASRWDVRECRGKLGMCGSAEASWGRRVRRRGASCCPMCGTLWWAACCDLRNVHLGGGSGRAAGVDLRVCSCTARAGGCRQRWRCAPPSWAPRSPTPWSPPSQVPRPPYCLFVAGRVSRRGIKADKHHAWDLV